ncbi:hypothetical protein TSAR_011616 [Trichomalopsis sarcophagae]|uniref:Uncharacterized protein n=1 Tax=Trichomalopsis sarcophagae TaxID=543379 RepID=A0A232FA10_9HYME|nr:hypothetical protein TSAR_011616 [Trichomalopsis sarcophagae]
MTGRLAEGEGARSVGIGRLLLFIYVLFGCGGLSLCQVASNDTTPDVFIEHCRKECAIYKNMMACGKYKAIKWINNVVQEKEYVYGPFKIIKIPAVQGERILPELPRVKKSNAAEMLHFIRESAEDLLTRRALVYTVDQPSGARSFSNGLMVLDDDELGQMEKSRTFDVSHGNFRIFKKKKNIILPILILLNLLKLKLMILPIALGVHFIKKLLVLGSLLLPSILSHLKICKIAQQPYHHHPWAAPVEYPVDYPTYSHEDTWDHRNDVATGAAGYGGYGNYYNSHSFYNPFSYYFQNYNKQQQR